MRLLCLSLLHLVIGLSSAAIAPTKELNDGNKIPALALGTAGTAADKARIRQAVNWAVEAGYRHIDTAALYHNEREIGEGIRDVVANRTVTREDLFITTKLWNDKHARDQVVPALRESLERLGLDYVDLYLVHYPMAFKADKSFDTIDYLETWKGMEDAKTLGLAKSIGVSNFNSEQIDRLLTNSSIKPAVNQIEVNPTLTQHKLVSYCQNLNITIMGYSPFGFLVSRDMPDPPSPRVDDPELLNIGQKYGKSSTQIVLRYLVDRGVIPIPKSTTKKRIEENINIFDFKLTPEEIRTVDDFNKNMRVVNVYYWKDHPSYPFSKD